MERSIESTPDLQGMGRPMVVERIYASAGGGSLPSAFCTIGTLADEDALRHHIYRFGSIIFWYFNYFFPSVIRDNSAAGFA
jgi:hypothetical protein